MSREHPFFFAFDVSNEFIQRHPDAAAKFIAIAKQDIAEQSSVLGPRGGTYRLISPPDVWEESAGDWYTWPRNITRYVTRRMGRYVRPSRAPRLLDSATFTTVSIPVEDGSVTLPRGQRIETEAKFVDVPVAVGDFFR